MAEQVEELMVTINVSLDEAETIQATLDDASEWHLSEHVKWCIHDAKQRAGKLIPARATHREEGEGR